MSDPAPMKRLSHHWDMDSQCLSINDPLSCDDPAENVSSIFAEHYGHALGPEVELKIDVSNVEDFDTSGIAFLIMFRDRLIDSSTRLTLIGPSPKLMGVIDLLGLSSEFGFSRTSETTR